MTRILLIPVAGTIAALAMIAYARQPRGEVKHPELPPFDLPDVPEHAPPPDEEPMDAEPEGEEPGAEETEPERKPEPREFQLRLGADGSLVGELVDPIRPESVSFASIEDLVKEIGAARHTLVITNGEGVDRARLDEVETSLRDRFKVVKVYRAPEAPPAEDR